MITRTRTRTEKDNEDANDKNKEYANDCENTTYPTGLLQNIVIFVFYELFGA